MRAAYTVARSGFRDFLQLFARDATSRAAPV
jgi:hypothetical protein